MNAHEFNRLNGLVAKLNMTTSNAKKQDRSFNKHYTESLEYLANLKYHLNRIEQGLTIGKFLNAESDEGLSQGRPAMR